MSDLPEIRNGASNDEISYNGDAISHFQRQVRDLSNSVFFLFCVFSIVVAPSSGTKRMVVLFRLGITLSFTWLCRVFSSRVNCNVRSYYVWIHRCVAVNTNQFFETTFAKRWILLLQYACVTFRLLPALTGETCQIALYVYQTVPIPRNCKFQVFFKSIYLLVCLFVIFVVFLFIYFLFVCLFVC